MAYNLSKYYRNILGLDLRVSDLLRNSSAATEAKNIIYRQTGALSKRNGYKGSADDSVGGAGLVKYNNIDLGTGIISEELLSMDGSLNKLTTENFFITYSGAGTSYFNLYLDVSTSTFKFDLYEDNAIVLSVDLGTGYGGSDTTIDQLATAINTITGFIVTYSSSTEPVALTANISRDIPLSGITLAFTHTIWITIDTPGTYTTPFTNHWAKRNQAEFEIASSAQLLDVMYISNGYDELHKYDGVRVYKAGLPQPTIPTDSVGAGTNLTAGEYDWKYTYEHTDAKQNILTSQESAITEFTSAGGDSRVITMTNLTAASGYGMAQAVVDVGGGYTGINITVDAGHGILAGDFIYAKDSGTGLVSKVEVTAVSATKVHVATSVTVADNAVLSQTKLSLWRTKSGGTLFYLVDEFINDNVTATTVYDDDIADASLVQDLISPIKVPGIAPKCKYIDVWRSQLVMTGNPEAVNTVYYSDFDVESFPIDQSFITEARLGGGNSGIKSLDNSLYIFKPRSIITCTGDLGTDQFQIDALGDDGVGCVSHATIKEVEGNLWFLGKQGIYSVSRQGHVKRSEQIEPKFDQNIKEKRATAHYWIEKDLYLVSFPYADYSAVSNTETLDPDKYFIMVYDLYRKAWYEWSNMNLLGGVAEHMGNIYFQSPSVNNVGNKTNKIQDTGLEDDYADHEEGIAFSYKTHWEALQEPSVYKKFLRLKVHSIDATQNDFETDKFQLNVVTEHDYRNVSISSFSLDFSGGVAGWGITPYGQFNWGEARLGQLSSKLLSLKAKSLRSIFTNDTVHQNVLISGYEYEIAAPYDMQMKD